MFAVVRSVAFYMGARSRPLDILQSRTDIGTEERLDGLYLLNIFQRFVRIFSQINLMLECPLPQITPHKYLNGVHIINIYHECKSCDKSSLDSQLSTLCNLHTPLRETMRSQYQIQSVALDHSK
ncbi:hypothetical protein HDE_12759 [Halotydeus destructor]|nr:hypothetical protein HDE_12759 [Halotydeus destructor]